MSVKGQLEKILKNIGIGQVVVIKQSSIRSSWGGYPKLRSISCEVRRLNRHGYLHTVVDRDRVIVVRLAYDDSKPGREYDERLKNEY